MVTLSHYHNFFTFDAIRTSAKFDLLLSVTEGGWDRVVHPRHPPVATTLQGSPSNPRLSCKSRHFVNIAQAVQHLLNSA